MNSGVTACTPGPAASLCFVWPLFFPQGSWRRRSAGEQQQERRARQAPSGSGRAAGAAPQGAARRAGVPKDVPSVPRVERNEQTKKETGVGETQQAAAHAVRQEYLSRSERERSAPHLHAAGAPLGGICMD